MDTSILVAGSVAGHPEFVRCSELIDRFAGQLCCSAHTLAETYSVLTGGPAPMRMKPPEAMLVIGDLAKLVTPISVASDEYLTLLQDTAKLGLRGGVVYDAIHMWCARSQKVSQVYTLSPGDFKRVAPDLAAIILEP